MSKIFISYNRENESIAKAISSDVEAIGHEVWLDQELSGGQTWWNQILSTIRNCDVFVLVLSPASLESIACKREYGYAEALGKPILPILVSNEVSTNLLPPSLSSIQFVDYQKQDRDTAFRLARAFMAVPPAKPLPDPLPIPPEVPLSYLGGLAQQVESTDDMNYKEQSALLIDLKSGLRDPENAKDTRVLLKKLRKRRDLYATIAEEIDYLLTNDQYHVESKQRTNVQEPVENQPLGLSSNLASSTVPKPKKQAAPKTAKPIQQQGNGQTSKAPVKSATEKPPPMPIRVKSALVGTGIGLFAGVIAMSTYDAESMAWSLSTALGGAIAGAISGNNTKLITVSSIGAFIGWVIVGMSFANEGPFAAGGVMGAPAGAVIAAVLGLIVKLVKK